MSLNSLRRKRQLVAIWLSRVSQYSPPRRLSACATSSPKANRRLRHDSISYIKSKEGEALGRRNGRGRHGWHALDYDRESLVFSLPLCPPCDEYCHVSHGALGRYEMMECRVWRRTQRGCGGCYMRPVSWGVLNNVPLKRPRFKKESRTQQRASENTNRFESFFSGRWIASKLRSCRTMLKERINDHSDSSHLALDRQ